MTNDLVVVLSIWIEYFAKADHILFLAIDVKFNVISDPGK